MTGHWDAAGLGAILAITYLALLLQARRIYRARLEVARAQRDGERTAHLHTRERYFAAIRRLSDLGQHIDTDAPIPYHPVWTTGAPPEAIDAEFAELMNAAFIAEDGA